MKCYEIFVIAIVVQNFAILADIKIIYPDRLVPQASDRGNAAFVTANAIVNAFLHSLDKISFSLGMNKFVAEIRVGGIGICDIDIGATTEFFSEKDSGPKFCVQCIQR
jgi:hypothetical protein